MEKLYREDVYLVFNMKRDEWDLILKEWDLILKENDEIVDSARNLSPAGSDREKSLERNRKAEYNYILEKVNRYFNDEDDVQAVTTLLTSMLKEAPLEDLELFEFGNLKFETSGEEYISISVGESVWSFYVEGYVEGSVEINGELYSQEPISYKPSRL